MVMKKKAAETLQTALGKLHFRGSALKTILPDAVEINRLENEADRIASQAVAKLFNDGLAPIEVMKWRDIYQQLEIATDQKWRSCQGYEHFGNS